MCLDNNGSSIEVHVHAHCLRKEQCTCVYAS